MHQLADQLGQLLLTAGPWLVLIITFTETAFFIGLLVPAEATVLIAAFLAERGYFNVWVVLAATCIGGFIGDQTGYLLGRYGGGRLIAREGKIARVWRRHEPRAASLFRKHASLSVSLARFISFVRTLMPWFAGMTRMRYGRFAAYDALGVLGWGAGSVAVGYLAGESWEAAGRALGRTTLAVVLGIVLIALVVAQWKRRAVQARHPLRVALTGNIASGKSSVVEIWRELGATVVDADVLARRAVERGTPGHDAVVRAFGPAVLAADGSIDRAKLRELVFHDPDERARLEAIVHPEVARLRQEEEQAAAARGARLVVNDIPLLFETGLHEEFDVIVQVHADDDVRLRRLTGLRGLDDHAARAMMAAQLPSDQKKEKAHIVIDNNGTLAELRQAAISAWRRIEQWPAPSA